MSAAPPASDMERQALVALRRMRGRLDASEAAEAARHAPLAIVGAACRFPGAGDIDAFWDLLLRGGDGIVDIPPDRWDAAALARTAASAGARLPSRAGLLPRIDGFDADFFGISGREARLMDPQQRMFLEVAWEALERAGIPPLALKGSATGVFVGTTTTDYLTLLGNRLETHEMDAYIVSGNTINATAGRVSYTLGLHGPAMAIDTACSSSLVAIDRACRSVREGESRLAIAGGVNLVLAPELMAALGRWGMLAPDGRCKTFDAAADGFVRAEGCGVVLIKRLADALADGDCIWALVRGSSVNHAGASGAFAVPNGLAQAEVLKAAVAAAQVDPAQLGYLEAHGTGTALGDPIEMEGIASVYGVGREAARALWVGAVKSNVGHLEAAAGVTGFIKTVLALRHGRIPPNLHLHTPSPHIAWDAWPVRVPTRVEEFPRYGKRRLAAVSAFGFSGTNAHVVLEEAPPPAAAPEVAPPPGLLLTISARNEAALLDLAERHADRLARLEAAAAMEHCLASAAARSHLPLRLAARADDAAELAHRLRVGAASGVTRGRVGHDRPGVAFLFTGQGAQYPGMGARLAQTSPVFRAALERCTAIIDPLLGQPLLPLLLDPEADPARLAQTGVTQPAMFAIEVALVEWWRSVGVEPAVVLGHSVGEFAAAWCAGVLSLEDAATLVTHRGALMQALPAGGAMAAVSMPEVAVAARLASAPGTIVIAGINAPQETVIAGDAEAVEILADAFSADGVRVDRLAVSHAFHSPRMKPMLNSFAAVARRIERRAPRLKVISSMTGAPADAQWGTPDYWLQQLQAPVRWLDAVRSAAVAGIGAALEIGPQPVLTRLGRRALPEAPLAWLDLLRRGADDAATVMQSLGDLYVLGAVDDWSGPAGAAARTRNTLPTYPFQHARHWVDAPRNTKAVRVPWQHPLLGVRLPLAGEKFVFETVAGDPRHAWVRDHRIGAGSLWPVAATVELLLAAARAAGLDSVELHDLTIKLPLALPDNDAISLQTLLRPDAQAWQIQLCRMPAEAGAHWPAIAQARIVTGRAPAPDVDAAALRARCVEVIEPDAFYSALAAAGAPFGKAFRSLVAIRRGDGEALGTARVDMPTDSGSFRLHPVLLDAALQLATAADPSGEPGQLWLPLAIDRVALFAEAPDTLQIHCRLQPSNDPARRSADFLAWTEDGTPVAAIEGVHFVRGGAVDLGAGSAVDLLDRCGLEVDWERLVPSGPASKAQRWSLEGGAGLAAPLGRALTQRGALVIANGEAADHRVFLAAIDPSTTSGMASLRPAIERVLEIVRHSIALPKPPRLWLVVPAAPPAAALVGLTRALRAEHPELRATIVEADSEADADIDTLADALLAAGEREQQIAVCGGEARVARLSPLPRPASFRLEAPRTGQLEDLTLVAQKEREPAPGEVRIAVEAAGLNFRDVLRVLGMVDGPLEGLGGECAGRVAAVGAGVTGFAPGDPVCAIAMGALASSVCVPQSLVAKRPDELAPPVAAALPIACLTASYGLEALAGLQRGQRVLIHAATGGVGMAAVGLAQHLGAEVYATAGSTAKRALLQEMGVPHVFDSRSLGFRDKIRDVTCGAGVDVVLNSLAGDFIEAGLSLVAPGGTFLELGKRGVWTAERVAARFPGIRYHVYDLGTVVLADPALAQALFARLFARLANGSLAPLPIVSHPMRDAAAAFRTMAQARHVGKLVLVRDPAASALERAPRADASYLVTGGFGAVGLAVAEGLVARGARHLILMGRRAPSAAAEDALGRLERAGAKVHRALADVADRTALDAALADAARVMPPLRGVVHAAGVLDDGVIAQLDWHRFETVLAPKLDGALNLADATAALPLDFLVLFSAGAGWIGAAGQANYAAANTALDALARALRAKGRPATAIAWGRFGGAGMAAARDDAGWTARGFGAIDPAQGISAMFQLIARDAVSAALLPVDWARHLAHVHGEAAPAFFDRLHTVAAPADPATDALAALGALAVHERGEALHQRLEGLVRKVIGIGPGRIIDPREPLRDLGMDSLMTVELRNAIGTAFRQQLPATLVFDFPTLEALTGHLLASLPGLAEPELEIPDAVTAAVQSLSEAEAEAELLAELSRGGAR